MRSLVLTLKTGLYRGLSWLRLRRQRVRLQQQLPAAIGLLTTAMAAGHSLKSSLRELAETMDEPLSLLFANTLSHHAAGEPLEKALEPLLRNHPSEEMELLVSAILSAMESGGSIRQVLNRIESMALSKKALRERLQAMTAQSRLQGIIMAMLPLFVMAAIYMMDPEYLQPILQTNHGRWVLMGTLIMNGIGLLWIRRISRISI